MSVCLHIYFEVWLNLELLYLKGICYVCAIFKLIRGELLSVRPLQCIEGDSP